MLSSVLFSIHYVKFKKLFTLQKWTWIKSGFTFKIKVCSSLN